MAEINDLSTVLLDAMEIMNRKMLQSVSYDTTIKATITEVIDGVNNTQTYKVKYQDSEFIVYAKENETYYVDDVVYIQVPMGNFDNQKMILMKETAANSNSGVFNLRLPFDDFIGLYDLSSDFTEKSFAANNPEDKYKYDLPGYTADNSGILIYEYPNAAAGSDALTAQQAVLTKAAGSTNLGLEMNVQTLLGSNVATGDYGLHVVVTGISKTQRLSASSTTTKEATFMTADMYGNPYNYLTEYTQQKLFDISDFISISSIKVYFDQDLAFTDTSGASLEYEGVPDNIIISDFNVYLGFSSSDLTEDKVILYTYDPLTYGNSTSNTKTLHLAWVHQDDDGFHVIDKASELPQHLDTHLENGVEVNNPYATIDAQVFWYQYEVGTANYNSYGGANWKCINPTGVRTYFEYDEDTNDYVSTTVTAQLTDVFELAVEPDTTVNTTKYKALVVLNNRVYDCEEILNFQNLVDVEGLNAEIITNDKIIIKGFTLNTDSTLTENSLVGNFAVYDINNHCIYDSVGQSFAAQEYYLQLYYLDESTATPTYKPLSDLRDYPNYSVNWHDEDAWPHSDSMITSWRKINTADSIYSAEKVATTRVFKIASILSSSKIDNTINVTVTLNGRTYNIRKELYFSRSGSNGTEYTLRISIDNPTGNSYIVKDAGFELSAHVYDSTGQEVSAIGKTWNYSWSILGLNETNGPASEDGETPLLNESTLSCKIVNMVPPVVKLRLSGSDFATPLVATRGLQLQQNSTIATLYDFNLPDRVEFASDGAKPIYYDGAFEAIKLADDTYEYLTWRINNTNFFSLSEKTVAAGVQSTAHTEYKLSCAAPQWNDKLATLDNLTYVYYTVNDIVQVAQAIAFVQNLYSSSLVNTWDGQSLSVDEENGTVLGTMFAAGYKDIENKFTGVMMGSTSSTGDESLDTPGLYGYSDGVQTFGFKRDGTGFIGASGQGRIEFDGHEALISNADKSSYINLNPADTTAVTNSINNSRFSRYFLYSKAGVATSTASSDVWYKTFLNDTSHNYFVVDPVRGVLTSGAVIARSGKIGNWDISENGLSQINTTANRYVYMGYSPMDKATYTAAINEVNTKYGTLQSSLQSDRDNAINTATTTANNAFTTENLTYTNRTAEDYTDQTAAEQAENIQYIYDSSLAANATAYANECTSINNTYTANVNTENNTNATNLSTLSTTRQTALTTAENTRTAAKEAEYGKYEPVIYKEDPVHDMNEGWGAQAVAEFLATCPSNYTTAVQIKAWIDANIKTILNLTNYKKADHYHYAYSNGTFTRLATICRSGWTDTIMGIFNQRYKINVSKVQTVKGTSDDYGTVVYNDYTKARTTWSSPTNRMNTNVYYTISYYTSTSGADSATYDIFTMNGPRNDFNNSDPWTRERLNVVIQSCQEAYNLCDHGSATTYTSAELAAMSDNELDGYQWQLRQIKNYVRTYIAPDTFSAIELTYQNAVAAAESTYATGTATEATRHTTALQTLLDTKNDDLAQALLDYQAADEQTEVDRVYNTEKEIARHKQALTTIANTRDTAIATAEDTYDAQKTALDANRDEVLNSLYDYDTDKYGLYFGDTAISGTTVNPPQFSVRWDGTMQSRKGILGINNPWVISDDGLACTISSGLTNSENYGTIFLGNPGIDSVHSGIGHAYNGEPEFHIYYDDTLQKWVSGYYSSYDETTHSGTLYSGDAIYKEEYPTGTTIRRRTEYLGTTNNNNARIVDYLLNSVDRLDGGTANFAIYAGKDTIKFGVTMDGYLYAHQGDIAGWSIEADKLVKYNSDGDVAVGLLSSGVIELCDGNIVLNGNTGTAKFGVNNKNGTIELAGFTVIGGTNDLTTTNISGIIQSIDAENSIATQKDAATEATATGSLKISYHYQNNSNFQLTDASTLKLQEPTHGGIAILSKTVTGDNSNVESVVLEPSFIMDTNSSTNSCDGYLNNWNFCGQSIYCTESYIKRIDSNQTIYWDKVATEQWVATVVAPLLATAINKAGLSPWDFNLSAKDQDDGTITLTLKAGYKTYDVNFNRASTITLSDNLINLAGNESVTTSNFVIYANKDLSNQKSEVYALHVQAAGSGSQGNARVLLQVNGTTIASNSYPQSCYDSVYAVNYSTSGSAFDADYSHWSTTLSATLSNGTTTTFDNTLTVNLAAVHRVLKVNSVTAGTYSWSDNYHTLTVPLTGNVTTSSASYSIGNLALDTTESYNSGYANVTVSSCQVRGSASYNSGSDTISITVRATASNGSYKDVDLTFDSPY